MSNFTKRLIVSFLFAPLILICIYFGSVYFNLLLFIILILGFYEIFLIRNIFVKTFIFLFLIIFLFCLYKIRLSSNGFYNLLLCLIITWASDSGGYLFGKLIGGKKINFISPNKTYIGFIGAILLPQILLFLINKIVSLDTIFTSNKIIIFLLTVASISGDLFFSYLKRLLKIKDYSQIIPGHGGLFDRIDSLIFVVISFFIIVTL